MPRRQPPGPPRKRAGPPPDSPGTKKGRKPLPEELARDAIAHEEQLPGDKVRMTFRVVLTRPQAEALAAWAIREETILTTLVTQILEAAAIKRATGEK